MPPNENAPQASVSTIAIANSEDQGLGCPRVKTNLSPDATGWAATWRRTFHCQQQLGRPFVPTTPPLPVIPATAAAVATSLALPLDPALVLAPIAAMAAAVAPRTLILFAFA